MNAKGWPYCMSRAPILVAETSVSTINVQLKSGIAIASAAAGAVNRVVLGWSKVFLASNPQQNYPFFCRLVKGLAIAAQILTHSLQYPARPRKLLCLLRVNRYPISRTWTKKLEMHKSTGLWHNLRGKARVFWTRGSLELKLLENHSQTIFFDKEVRLSLIHI